MYIIKNQKGNNVLVILIIIALLILFALSFYFFSKNKSVDLGASNQVTTNDNFKARDLDQPDLILDQKPATTAVYTDYSQEAYETAKPKRRVLFFFANWCPTCQAANADFNKNLLQLPTDVVLFKTNYDTESALKEKYAITYQHTFVQVDEQGNEIKKWNGGASQELLQNILP